MDTKIKILLADDHKVLRDGLRALLEALTQNICKNSSKLEDVLSSQPRGTYLVYGYKFRKRVGGT